TAALRQALLDAATPERMRALAERLFQLAESGDVTAAKLLLSYLIGRPAIAADPDRLDVEEVALRKQGLTPEEIRLLCVQRLLDPAAGAVFLREMGPWGTATFACQLDREGKGSFAEALAKAAGLEEVDPPPNPGGSHSLESPTSASAPGEGA